MEGDEPGQAAEPRNPEAAEKADRAARQKAYELGFGPHPDAHVRAAELAQFRAQLAALTPRLVVTPLLIGANVLVFAIMVASGVSFFSPTSDNLLAWGANYGPLSADGQWWRLATAMFLHFGVVHLLMNMWVLWDAGQLVERLLGPIAFATAYLLAGLAGSCASVLWSPDRPSAGASGAIFGIFGMLGAFLLRQRRALPLGALSKLTRSSLLFVGYNVIYGLMQPNIDMAAHLGGLAGGFVVALPLVHELTPAARLRAWRRATLVTAVGLAVMGGLWSRAPQFLRRHAQASLVRFGLPGASIGFPRGADRDDRLDYDAGQIRRELTGGYVVLSWSTTEMMTDAEERRILDPVVQSVKERMTDVTLEGGEAPVAGGDGLHYVMRGAGGRAIFAMSVWPCGKRVFNLSGGFAGATLEPTILASFACDPDPAREGKRTAIGVELDAGPDFGSIDRPGALGMESLDDELFVVLRFSTEHTSEKSRDELMPGLLAGVASNALPNSSPSFGPRALERGPGGTRAVWRGQAYDQSERLLAVEILCGADRYLGMYCGSAAQPEARGLVPLLAARCSAAPRRPPSIAELARAACARGDKRGCALRNAGL